MKKKILIGSIFVLALLLLMPSIPAIQQNTIEDIEVVEIVTEETDCDCENDSKLDGDFPILCFILYQSIMLCIVIGSLTGFPIFLNYIYNIISIGSILDCDWVRGMELNFALL